MKSKRHYIILVAIFFISFTSFSQLRVGDFRIDLYKFNKTKKKTIDRLENKTIKFVLPDFYSKAQYDSILKEAWSVTPYEIILLEDFKEEEVKKDDVLALFTSRYFRRPGGTNGVATYRHFCFLDFIIIDKIRKKFRKSQSKWESSKIGGIYFSLDIYNTIFDSEFDKDKTPIEDSDVPSFLTLTNFDFKKREHYFPKIEKLEHLSNFRLGYLKNFLQQMNKAIKQRVSIDIYDDIVEPELKNLKNKTLYIDENFKFNKIISEYSYDYKIVDYETIEEMIRDKNNNSDFYYLVRNQIGYTQVLTIVNGKTGEMIYQNKSYTTSDIREKDIKKLNSKIKKLNK